VVNELYDLLIDLDASDEATGSFRSCTPTPRPASPWLTRTSPGKDLQLLFEAIIKHIPAPSYDPAMPLQIPVTNLDIRIMWAESPWARWSAAF
jgi:GTP-binding protein